ncbi:MAG: nucleoside-diphosphate kinase [Calditrichaeota bacterium]|nr:MAG: nucleoside-diphosphate kinase [Calditrichota bacterium]MBL1203774.1 nucleoside-diphosphate kinase [Calditrichota bacterium]NOG43604.1 nucleoside-diphosphate kinase [Calditrichota bacterium]
MSNLTLAILKPDCVQNNNVGKVIDHLLSAGFKITAMKMMKLTKETAGAFYEVHKERPFYGELVDFMMETRVVPIVLEKENAVAALRETIGATDPAEAEEGTVRKLYAENKGRNTIHASDSDENAAREIRFFFSETEVISNS